jgi:hypothetical protein
MLKLAVEAQLPLISVTTRDTLNLARVLKHVIGKTPAPCQTFPTALAEGGLYVHFCGKEAPFDYASAYVKLVKREASLILVNPRDRLELVFDAGIVPVPRKLLLEFMTVVADDREYAKTLLPALGGCTLKEAAEYARLTMARDKSLTSAGLMLTRKTCFVPSQGLAQVDSGHPFYQPPGFLADRVKKERPFFLNGHDPRLVPRGLLMAGPPGVGKTEASKYIANMFGVPLFRLDLGGVKYKYVGTSEANMSAALSQLDHEEPCIALLDEIEKLFGSHSHDTSGVTASLLAQLLWWLAERRSRVLAVMTTNDRRKLPPELYREGRIDQTMWFKGFEFGGARAFASALLTTFEGVEVPLAKLEAAIEQVFKTSPLPTDPPTVSHAALTKMVYGLVKEVTGGAC